MSEIPVDEEKEAAILKDIIIKKKYPTNPLKVINEFKKLKKEQIIKLSICAVIVILFAIFNNIKIIGNPTPDNQCYYDVLHEWAKTLNNFYRGNKPYRTILTIMGSITIDIVYIINYFCWGVYAVDWRYGLTTMCFYGIRYIMQETIRLKYPDKLFFEYPGFPSIVVAYIQGSDFFFSGHCGFPIIGAMEFIWLKKYYFAAYFVFVSFVELFLMINCREHYTIDIIVGIVFSHYITILCREWIKGIYDHFNFLNRLKLQNREELKRIGSDFDIGD